MESQSMLARWMRGSGQKFLLYSAALFFAVCLIGSVTGVGPQVLGGSGEASTVGGSNCSDFMNGAAVGLGVGALLGCVWCVGGVLVAKGIALFC
jgi:hypothetical protein